MRKNKWLRGLALSVGALAVLIAVSGLVSCADLFGSDDGGGGGGESDKDGIVTISLTGAAEKNDWELGVAVVEEGGHPETDLLAGDSVLITSGTAEFTTAGDWQGSGGTTYDVYMLIQEVWGAPAEGDLLYCEFPYTYTQNGDLSISLTYGEDFGGGLGVQLTGFVHSELPGTTPDGEYVFSAWVYVAGTDGEDLLEAEYLLGTSGYKSIDAGVAEVQVMTHAGNFEPGSDLWVGDQDESYDVYYQIDGPDDGIWWTPPSGSNFPEVITIDDGIQLVEYTFNGGDWAEYE